MNNLSKNVNFVHRYTARKMSRVHVLYNVQSVVRHSKYDVQIKMAEDETALSSNDEVKRACLLRNQNEKRRRDRFNNLVSELSVALPVTGKKLSRNNVLKYAIEHFRQAKQLATSSAELNSRKLYGRWQPDFITSEEFRKTIFDGLSGIVMAVSETSKIFYVSSNTFSCLGYDCEQLLNNSILDLVHPEDQRMIYSLLTSIRRNSADSSHNPPQLFTCRFRCGPQNQGSNNSFEAFRCVGRSFRGLNHTEGNDCCLVLHGRVAFFPTVNHAVVLSDAETVSKFTTRLNKMWRFECVERSTTLVLGYYPFELLGACFYEYCHDEDLANLTEYHNMLPYSGVITTCCYRLLTKGQVWIWVRSRCHVSYSQLNSKPDSVICVTWPMKGAEFNMFNQEEVLERDRRLFSQILEKNGEKKPEKNGEKQPSSSSGAQNAVSSSSSSSSSAQGTQKNAALSHMTSSVKVITVNPGAQSHTMNDNSDFLSTIPVQCSTGLAGSQSVSAMWSCDTHVDSTAILTQRDGHYILNGSVDPPMENVDVNSLLLEDYVEMPESLSLSQWAIHLHLRDQYKSLTESIRQQSEQISVIQRQLAIQKELSELSDELEVQEKLKKQNLHNTVEETRAIIHQKMRELQDCSVAV